MDALKNIASKVQGSSAGHGSTTGTGATGGSNGDALDNGVNQLASRSGHSVNASTTEKISDGIRTGFKKASGKDVPIADKEYR